MVSDECSISGGAKAVAKFWADILLRSDADTTSARWSMRNIKVACAKNCVIRQKASDNLIVTSELGNTLV